MRELRRIAQELDVSIRGFHQMTDAEVARDTGLSVQRGTHGAAARNGRALSIHRGEPGLHPLFLAQGAGTGLPVQRGGRFWHFTGSCDKGLAMSVLIGFYRMAWQTRIFTIALGDSANDLTMLRLVDRPILIPKPDGSFDKDVTKAIPRIARANKPGPHGWSVSLLRALQGHNGTGGDAAARSAKAQSGRVFALP